MSKNSRLKLGNEGAPVLKLNTISQNQVFLFIIWPFGQMISALRNFRKPWSMTLLWLFCVYFGLVFVYGDPFFEGGSDSSRYARVLIDLHAQPVSFDALWSSLYSIDSNLLDIYQPLLTWLISIFTGNPAFLFSAFAAVFGFFYVKNLWMIFSRISVKVGVILFLFMLGYALVNPIWKINGVRMWTAAQVFLYGNLLFFLYNDKRGLWWSAASLFFHFSFMFPVAILLFWQFVPRKAGLIFGFYIATLFVSEINLLGVRNLLSFLPDIFQSRVSSYTDEAYALKIAERQSGAHVILAENITRWVTYLWIIFAFLKRKDWKDNYKTYYNLFLFALFLGSLANIASNVPSGGRFLTVSKGLFYALFVLLLGKNYLQLKWLKIISFPLLAYAAIFQIRVGFEYMGFLTVAGNPLIALFIDTQTPLIDFVKEIF